MLAYVYREASAATFGAGLVVDDRRQAEELLTAQRRVDGGAGRDGRSPRWSSGSRASPARRGRARRSAGRRFLAPRRPRPGAGGRRHAGGAQRRAVRGSDRPPRLCTGAVRGRPSGSVTTGRRRARWRARRRACWPSVITRPSGCARWSACRAFRPLRRSRPNGRAPPRRAIERERERLGEIEGVVGDVAYGDASEELARFAAEVDLLIVGSRGYGPLGRLINGSTSTYLARHSPRPLLVIPRCLTESGQPPSDGPSRGPRALVTPAS